jgi:hypothetical protein
VEWFAWPPVLIAVGVVVLIAGASFWGLYFFVAQSRRDAEGAAIQQALAARLGREPGLATARLMPDIDIPRHGPVRVTLTGDVSSFAARDTALRAVSDEAARLGCAVRVVDRIEVKREASL